MACEHLTLGAEDDCLFAMAEGHGAEGTGRLAALTALDELRTRHDARALVCAQDLLSSIQSMNQRIVGLRSSPAHSDASVAVSLLLLTGDRAQALVDPSMGGFHVVQAKLASALADGTSLHLRTGDALVLCSSGLRGLVTADDVVRILASCRDPDQVAEEILDQAAARGARDERSVLVLLLAGKAGERIALAVTGGACT